MLTHVICWYFIYAERNQQILILILRQVGGSMGLWLGLGVLQILQHIITISGPIIKKCYFKALKKTWNWYQIAHFLHLVWSSGRTTFCEMDKDMKCCHREIFDLWAANFRQDSWGRRATVYIPSYMKVSKYKYNFFPFVNRDVQHLSLFRVFWFLLLVDWSSGSKQPLHNFLWPSK